jgi:hypothetical protein
MIKTKKESFSLDIFKILRQLNSGDLKVYEKLSEEEKKGFAPYVIIQWMWVNCTPIQATLLNEFVNPYLFSFGKNHTELLAKLLAVSSIGGNRQFKWVPFTKKAKEQKLGLQVIMEYFDYTENEAKGNLVLLTEEDIVEMAMELGWEKDAITKLKKEYKA